MSKGSSTALNSVVVCDSTSLSYSEQLSHQARKNLAKCSMLLVAMRFGETPVHIPNTMVKTKAADDTMLETAWESRWLPDL